MARFVTGNTFGTTDTVTSTTLNNAVNNAAISTDSVDNSTIEVNSNALRLKDSSSKTTGVTFAKMQHISTAKILGRASASEGDVEEAFDFKDEDDMSSNSATALSSQQSIKAYVDANALTPSYVGISSNSSLTITQTDTSTTTHTYPIANFVGTGFNAAKVTGFYVEITASCRRLSTKTIADVKATFPDGTDHVLLGHSCDTPEDQTSESRGTVFCPVTIGQTNLVIKPTLSGNTKTTTFTIVGCTQFV